MPAFIQNFNSQLEFSVENLFSLAITQKKTSTKIIMQLLNNQVSTSEIPFIVELLKERLPNVLLTQCFNDQDLPFSIEVRNTELGHLFEHILLEYLCQLKIAKGYQCAVFSGRTKWNWIRDPKGKFHIHLNCGEKDADILPLAVEKTVALMRYVLENKQQQLFPARRFFYSRNGLKNGKRSRKKLSPAPLITLKL